MTADVRARVEAAILRVLADGRPRTGWELAEALRADPATLAGADGWPALLGRLRAAGRLTCSSGSKCVLWATPPAGPALRPRPRSAAG